jgi:small-conductance mechanosensitive channel
MVLLLINGLAKRNLRRSAIKSGVNPDAVNGIILAIRFGILYIGVMIFFLVFPELLADFIGVWNGASLLIGTAIGLAIGQAVNNFVSGLYIMFSRPFSINDYVQVGTKEGIVVEISLNYTKILQQDGTNALVPNNRALTSDIVNFSYDKRKLQQEEQETSRSKTRQWNVIKRISEIIDTHKIIRYVFTLNFHIDKNIKDLNLVFNKVANKWTKKFGFRPLYEITDANQFAYTYLFTLFVDDPRKILQYKSHFIEDLVQNVHIANPTK